MAHTSRAAIKPQLMFASSFAWCCQFLADNNFGATKHSMPALALIHQQGLACATCGALVAKPGSQSVVTTKDGAIILFADADPPAQLALAIVCEKGHQTKPPPSVRIEMAGSSPSAPEAANAVALNGTLRSGKKLTF